MIFQTKKALFQELAVCLKLTLEFDPDTSPLSLIRRIRERALVALQAAVFYTGVIGQVEIQKFLEAKPLQFSIECKSDILKGDTIRFTEDVFDNRRKPPRRIGKRIVTAEVIGLRAEGMNTILAMRVIQSAGVWELKADKEIRRTLKNVSRYDAARAPWPVEAQRGALEPPRAEKKTPMREAAAEAFASRRKEK